MKGQMHQLQEVSFVSSQVNEAVKYSLEAVDILMRVSAVTLWTQMGPGASHISRGSHSTVFCVYIWVRRSIGCASVAFENVAVNRNYRNHNNIKRRLAASLKSCCDEGRPLEIFCVALKHFVSLKVPRESTINPVLQPHVNISPIKLAM